MEIAFNLRILREGFMNTFRYYDGRSSCSQLAQKKVKECLVVIQ